MTMVFTDEELTAQALAADPDQLVDDDATPFVLWSPGFGDVLPDWYMPAPAAHPVGAARRRAAVVGGIVIASLLAVNALGLCVTYGHLELPL